MCDAILKARSQYKFAFAVSLGIPYCRRIAFFIFNGNPKLPLSHSSDPLIPLVVIFLMVRW